MANGIMVALKPSAAAKLSQSKKSGKSGQNADALSFGQALTQAAGQAYAANARPDSGSDCKATMEKKDSGTSDAVAKPSSEDGGISPMEPQNAPVEMDAEHVGTQIVGNALATEEAAGFDAQLWDSQGTLTGALANGMAGDQGTPETVAPSAGITAEVHKSGAAQTAQSEPTVPGLASEAGEGAELAFESGKDAGPVSETSRDFGTAPEPVRNAAPDNMALDGAALPESGRELLPKPQAEAENVRPDGEEKQAGYVRQALAGEEAAKDSTVPHQTADGDDLSYREGSAVADPFAGWQRTEGAKDGGASFSQTDGEHASTSLKRGNEEEDGQISGIREEAAANKVDLSAMQMERAYGSEKAQIEVQAGTNEAGEIKDIYADMLKDIIARQIADGRQELSISLTPKNLGSLLVKVVYAAGATTVSIVCSNAKTMQAMSQRAGELGRILETTLGDKMEVVVDDGRQGAHLYEDGRNGTGAEAQKEQQEQRQEENRRRQQHAKDPADFLMQLRLGLA